MSEVKKDPENEEVVETVEETEEVVEETTDEVEATDDEAIADASKTLLNMFEKMLDDRDAKREKSAPAFKKNLYGTGDFAKEVDSMGKDEKALTFIKAVLRKDYTKLQVLSEGTPANGGFLVIEEWHNEIVQEILDMAVVRPNATVIQIQSNQYHVVSNSSRPRAGWRSELAVKQTSTANFGEIILTPYSLAVIVPVSQELQDDASVGQSAGGVISYLTTLMSEALALEEDVAYLNGNGSGKPTGITTYGIYTIAGGKNVTADQIIRLFHKIKAVDRAKAVWVMSGDALGVIASLKDSQNRPLFDGALTSDGLSTLKGKKVFETDVIGRTILFGNLSAYFIADKTARQGGKISVRVSDEAYVGGQSMFERNEIAIRVEERTDGELTRTSAVGMITNAY